MKKIELFVETKSEKKIFFFGSADKAFLTEFKMHEQTHWQLVLYFSGHVVFRTNYAFNPVTVVQQLIQQEIELSRFNIQQLDLDTQQELLDQNTRVNGN